MTKLIFKANEHIHIIHKKSFNSQCSLSARVTFSLLDKKWTKDDTGACFGLLFGNVSPSLTQLQSCGPLEASFIWHPITAELSETRAGNAAP